MFSWHSIPFARVAIPMVFGIGLSNFINIELYLLLGSIAVLLLSLWLSPYLIQIKYRYNWRQFKGLQLVLLFFLIGCLSGSLQFYHRPSNHYTKTESKYLSVRISEIRKSDSVRTTAIAEVKSVICNNNCDIGQGKIYLKLYKTDKNLLLKTGQSYIVPNKCKAPEKPDLPWDFDFAFYLKTNGIDRILILNDREIYAADTGSENLVSLAEKSKNACISVLRKLLKRPEYYGIAEGLLIGYRDDIIPEVAEGFSNSGTIHILSTSGMHVALIFSLLNLLTAFLKGNKKSLWLQYFILLSGLWFYAFICGLGPSIVRATITFSLAGLGRLLERKPDNVNLVFATAFFQLCLNPLELFQVGFQLSYAAVFGILTLNPVLNKLWQPQNKILKHLRDLLSVSIAAQIYTWPISCYYFGSFPLLFLIANLLLIPVSSMILYTCIGLLLFQTLPYIGPFICSAMKSEIEINNKIAVYFSRMDASNIKGIHLSLECAIVLSLAVLFFSLSLKYRQKGLLILTFISITTFSCLNRIDKQSIKQKDVTIYFEKRNSIKYLIKGEKCFIVLKSKQLTAKVNLKEIESRIKSRLGSGTIRIIGEDELFVSTNLIVIPGVGIQFFDKIMTLK